MAKLSLVSWNIGCREDCWQTLKTDLSLDVALLQEAIPPSADLASQTIPAREQPWGIAGWTKQFCAAIALMSDRMTMRPIPTTRLDEPSTLGIGVSRPGTLAAAELELGGETIIVVSMYAAWEKAAASKMIYADASAHRLVSDLSAIVTSKDGHRIIAAGDLNIYFGHGEKGSTYWRDRYLSVFARMEAMGLPLVGPCYPGGVQAEPWPPYLPADSKNVPTFRTRRSDPTSASYQLDFVFASRDLHDRLTVTALNGADDWGPSDHCRVRIELD